MVKRGVGHHCVRIATALALLVTVSSSPLRPFKSSSNGGAVRSIVAFVPAAARAPDAPRLSPTRTASRLVWVKALRTETEEEELTGATSTAAYRLDLPPATCLVFAKVFTATDGVESLYPLRC